MFEWDAAVYAALPLPHKTWGARVIEQLALTGTETVIELGCGPGRDTKKLLDALPTGRVVAVDGSAQMLAELHKNLDGYRERLRVVRADLREPLDLGETADAAMSVATLHWLPDHGVVFRSVAAALRPGGRFVAEAGGAGNIARFRQAVTDAGGDDGSRLWNFADADTTRQRLAAAGFTDVDVNLVSDPARLEPGEHLETFIATVLLAGQLRELPEHERRPFVREVARRLPEPVIDYVRLQISAVRRPPSS